MNPEFEIRRLLEMMPASGRMLTRIVSKPEQRQVIVCPFPPPWKQDRPIFINFDFWGRLSAPQRDLLILRTVSWLLLIRWFKLDLYRGLMAAGTVGTLLELVQGDAVGTVAAGVLVAIAGSQVWRGHRSVRMELEADENGLQVALRRGYTEEDGARHLLGAIETVARLEDRPQLSFTELVRCQNLRAIANFSPVSVPQSLRED